jgi:hypothetical protein
MSSVRRVVVIVIAAYLLLVLYDRFVLVELLARRVGVALLLAIVEVAALIGTGFAVRGLFARRWKPAEIDIARELLIGYPSFGALCFLLGTLNVSSWSMGALLVIAAVGGAYAIVRRFESRPADVGRYAFDPVALIAIAVVIGCGFIAAQAPPTSLDELAYHLAVPWSWVQEHRAIDLPLISHSYFPLGIESADLPLLAILGQSGAMASHFLHLAAAIAATALLLRLAGGNGIAAAAVIATPALALTAGWSLVDFPLIGICAALVLEEDEAGPAIAAGLLTKYTFVPFALIVLFWSAARRRRSESGASAPHSKGVLAGAALGSMFFVRNLVLTGNPIAPFLGAAAPHVAGYRHALLSDYVFSGSFVDESLGASLLAAGALTAGALFWILVAAGVALFFLAPSARVLLPFFAIPAARSQPPGRIMRVLLVVAVAVQLLLIGWFVDRNDYFSLMSAKASDEEFLAKQRPSCATIAAVDAALPPSSRTLVVGLNETFWFAHRVRGGGNFDGPRMSRYLEAPTPEALYNRLRGDGITHVAVVAPPAPTADEKKMEERETTLSPAAQRALALMLDRFAASVVARERATLFTLR